ncbi:MFS transporter [Nocardioides agariphilus]|jgi:MFS family permease|uniref:MFS transporter n=1 Tax=Nocardioides agariphilus TaxID=433664 RepID=A0A930YK76_9ACTN|nr:MFS transporter [Nocardioides agariphilus]MBF4769948.1 MFS transporter [Nocardioides agariphilus]
MTDRGPRGVPEDSTEPFSGIPRGQQRQQVKKVGRALGTGARATGRGVAATARVTGRLSRFTVRQARRAANAQGADHSGLSRLIEMHAFNTAGDAAVAISLAGSLFFQVPSGEARDQVALFLGLTMLPFAIVAPLIGPFLDRFAHGRRWAIGATMALRAFLCWVLASSVSSGSATVFAAALGVLVASKAYGVTRAAAVPRLLPRDFTLVKANGRVSLSGIVGATVSAPIAGLASLAGSEWSLRYAFVLFVIATIGAIRLPAKVDSSEGEGEMTLRKGGSPSSRRGRLRTQIPAQVAFALRANCGPWFMSGFLLMFVAFLLRNPDVRPDSSLSAGVMIGIVVGAAGLGRVLGTLAASTLRRVTPAVAVVLALLADAAAALLAALFYGVWSLALLGMVAGLAQALAKFSLDATIQRHIPPQVQASAFGRSDTTCQLAWVLGGFIGIALPLDPPRLGLSVAFVVVAAWTGFVLTTVPNRRRNAVSDANAVDTPAQTTETSRTTRP